MAKAGAPLGNQNAAKGRQWSMAIDRALARLAGYVDNGPEPAPKVKALDMLADAFISKLQAEGDLPFFKELGDRLDGKAAQQMILTGDEENPVAIQEVRRVIVKP